MSVSAIGAMAILAKPAGTRIVPIQALMTAVRSMARDQRSTTVGVGVLCVVRVLMTAFSRDR